MNGVLGWVLAPLAVAAGYAGYGWRGALLGVTVVAFWLLLQFSRALRTLREAAGRPVGEVANAVMFNARLHAGMRLPAILKITRSLGRKLGEVRPEADEIRRSPPGGDEQSGRATFAHDPETYAWADAAGDEVEVELRQGRVTAWRLRRAGGGA